MSDAGDTTPAPTPTSDPALPDPKAKDDLTKLRDWAQSFAAREKQEGRNSVLKDVAEKLGMNLDDAAKLIQSGKEAEEAKLTEAEKRLARATERNEEARKLNRQAEQIILDTLKIDALMDLGMSRAAARASTDLVKVDTSGTVSVESVVEAATATRAIFPQLFTATPPPPGGHAGNGDRLRPTDSASRAVAQPAAPGNSARERAEARLIERHARANPPSILAREPEINAQRRSS